MRYNHKRPFECDVLWWIKNLNSLMINKRKEKCYMNNPAYVHLHLEKWIMYRNYLLDKNYLFKKNTSWRHMLPRNIGTSFLLNMTSFNYKKIKQIFKKKHSSQIKLQSSTDNLKYSRRTWRNLMCVIRGLSYDFT